MKRILALIITFTMALCLFSCVAGGNGGKTYTGIYGDEEATLVINGNKATLSAEFSRELALGEDKKITITNISTMTGVITSNEDGVIVISFGVKGATAKAQIKVTGSGAAEYKEMVLAQINEMEDGAVKEAQKKLINGKAISMAYGDELWDDMGPGNDRVITITIDEEKGTFTVQSEEY